jgi:hypothetical protein
MLNRTALVFVSLAAILGFALGGSVVWNLQFGYTAIQTIDTTQQHHSANAKAVQEWEKPEDALARYTWWLTAFTGVLAIATIGLGAATIWLCLAGERQFKLARDEFRSTHRPKIRVKHFYLVSDIWQDEPIIVNITFVNHGTAEAIPAEIGLRYFVVLSTPTKLLLRKKMPTFNRGAPVCMRSDMSATLMPLGRCELRGSVEF